LEKIEMKKTLVAVAALAVASAAMADATISGVIDQAYYSAKSTTSAGLSTQSKGIGAQNNGTSEFTIAGSEDLDGGMKASYAFNMQAAIDNFCRSSDASQPHRLARRIWFFEVG